MRWQDVNGGKIINQQRWNCGWHEFTVGAIGNILLLLTGLLVSLLSPEKAAGPSRLTLWTWLAMRRQARLAGRQAGEPG